MRSLSWKLTGSFLLVVLVAIGITAYLINQNINVQFRNYVTNSGMMYGQKISTSLSDYYLQTKGWPGVQTILNTLLRSDNDRLVLADNSGTIVADTDNQWLGKSSNDLGLTNGISIQTSGQTVGTLYVYSPEAYPGRGYMGGRGIISSGQDSISRSPETDFLSRINSYLWIAGLVALVVALVMGIILTRQIIRPVRALTDGAKQISKGNLSHRVKVNSRDEIGQLATSFNSMATSLDRSEQSRKQLVSDISHELRTPLTIIEGTVDGIIDGVFPADREHLGSIKEQTSLLNHVISDLRDLSLAESGRLQLEYSSVSVPDLIRRKLSQFEPKAREKGVQMGFDMKSELPEIMADSMRLEQAVANLLSNAIRHTPAGGSIIVSLASVNPEPHIGQPGLVISVADTGEGIAPEHLSHIFERFYRVGDSRSRSEGGVGLGLAIVKQMVQAHQGQVWVESQSGKGSIFYVALPLSKAN